MMTKTEMLQGRSVTVVGAGLVGGLLACYLARHGARVDLIERRPDLRHANLPGGRTIAMSLSHRGWRALAGVGLEGEVRQDTHPKHIRCVHLPDGTLQHQQYGRDDHALWTVNRKRLNCTLLDHAEATGRVRLRFETQCRAIDPDARTLDLESADGRITREPFSHLIGADGMNSDVRAALCARGDVSDEITTLDYRYFELSMPPRTDGAWALAEDCVHIWPRSEGLMVALPNRSRTFTGTFFYHRGEQDYFGGHITDVERSRRFRTAFPEVASLIPNFEHELATNPASDIKAIRCWPWHVDDRVLLVGDACHAIVPFYAMGMNAGFEDCTVFDELVTATGGDLGAVFAQFPVRRKRDTDAIGDLSLRNFTSIGRSADPDYDRRWRLERALWSLFPEAWTPLYAMIHFSHRPLHEVVQQHEAQAAVLKEICARYPADADEDLERLAAFVAPLLGADEVQRRTG